MVTDIRKERFQTSPFCYHCKNFGVYVKPIVTPTPTVGMNCWLMKA